MPKLRNVRLLTFPKVVVAEWHLTVALIYFPVIANAVEHFFMLLPLVFFFNKLFMPFVHYVLKFLNNNTLIESCKDNKEEIFFPED